MLRRFLCFSMAEREAIYCLSEESVGQLALCTRPELLELAITRKTAEAENEEAEEGERRRC
jgi:hypothetical protein